MPPLAHRCIYRSSQAVVYFRAVLLLQPGLIYTDKAISVLGLCFMDSSLYCGCSKSIKANAVAAHKAGTVIFFPAPPRLCIFCRDTLQVTCMEGAEALGRVEGWWGRTLCKQLGWLGKARLSHFLWGVGRMHLLCGSPT